MKSRNLSCHVFTVIPLLLVSLAAGDPPAGYYDPASGLYGDDLQQALHDIIDDHNSVSYDYIWQAFCTTDDKPGNIVWDMYSDVPGGTPPYTYTLIVDQGGSASGEGEGYNREHSWPRSWFDDDAPMNTDLFHIVPSDIYVNNRRGNYPYGEVDYPTWTSLNGSRLGPCSYTGYSGTVFEPIDGYKGDFARNYFYMATRYYGEDAGWTGSPMTDGAVLKQWAENMLIEWHLNDPVSPKETERNDAVYAIQYNRNPFIDHPEYVLMVYDPTSVESPDARFNVASIDGVRPDPFRSSAEIHFSLSAPSNVNISIYDVTGRIVASPADGLNLPAGSHTASWDGRSSSGLRCESGLYFCVLTVSGETLSERIVKLD